MTRAKAVESISRLLECPRVTPHGKRTLRSLLRYVTLPQRHQAKPTVKKTIADAALLSWSNPMMVYRDHNGRVYYVPADAELVGTYEEVKAADIRRDLLDSDD